MSARGWTFPQVGQRVRINALCPWPERVGLTATVIAPPADGTYPQPAKWEVVLHIDADPLIEWRDLGWTCVMSAKCCEPIGVSS